MLLYIQAFGYRNNLTFSIVDQKWLMNKDEDPRIIWREFATRENPHASQESITYFVVLNIVHECLQVNYFTNYLLKLKIRIIF